ncbi:MAG: homoserine/homoserine lactone efflux protein, partial [Enterobacterales bacterium]
TILLISATPGMCMTLALTLGMSIGVKRTLWMMIGELTGVALVSVLAVVGVASLMLNYPTIFDVFKYVGGAYLVYLGSLQWLMRGKMTIDNTKNSQQITGRKLILQGFITAIANPKGWAFTVSLLPSFINPNLALTPQLISLVIIILISEFIFLMLYASGGRTLGKLLGDTQNVRLINRISGSLMIIIGFWLAFG